MGAATSAGAASSAPTRPRTSSGCAGPSMASTRSPGSAPSGSGSCSTSDEHVAALGALTGNQAVQMVRGRAEGDLPLRLAGRRRREPRRRTPIPTRASIPANSVPAVVRRINNALLRADQIEHRRGHATARTGSRPIVADAEAGFGGPLNAFELMKAMIEAGAAGVHFEDQLASEKKCGHLGGKVLVPTQPVHPHAERGPARGGRAGVPDGPRRPHRRAQRDAAHQRRRRARPPVPDRRAHGRGLLPRPRRHRGRDRPRPRLRALRRPALVRDRRRRTSSEAGEFAEAIHEQFPGKLLAYNCSPSFNWKQHLDDDADRQLPARARRHGLPVPVHHAGRLPRAQRVDVRARPRLRRGAA